MNNKTHLLTIFPKMQEKSKHQTCYNSKAEFKLKVYITTKDTNISELQNNENKLWK